MVDPIILSDSSLAHRLPYNQRLGSLGLGLRSQDLDEPHNRVITEMGSVL